jgi:hypothetical protein
LAHAHLVPFRTRGLPIEMLQDHRAAVLRLNLETRRRGIAGASPSSMGAWCTQFPAHLP